MRTSVAVNMCINCSFFTLIFAVFLLMSSPVSWRSISTVNQTLKFSRGESVFKPCSKSRPNCYISHKFWKLKFAHLLQDEVAGRLVIWCSLQHLQRIFVTFCVILCETRFYSLNDCRPILGDRPEQETCTTFPIPS